MWYLPNVPANHGMLQRLRPEPMSKVQIGSPTLRTGLPGQDTELRSQFFHDGTEGSAVDEATEGGGSSAVGSPMSSKTNSTLHTTSTAKSPKGALPIAEQLVTTREDVFELFDRDGPGSAVYVYSAKRLTPA